MRVGQESEKLKGTEPDVNSFMSKHLRTVYSQLTFYLIMQPSVKIIRNAVKITS